MKPRALAVSLISLCLTSGRSFAEEPQVPAAPGSMRDLERQLRRMAEENDARMRRLEQENQKLREMIERATDDQKALEKKVERVAPAASKISGYLDVGFFYVGGNGSGIRQDIGNQVFPEYRDTTWVFMGDPLATAINSRGEPADTDGSRALRWDAVNGNGKATFIANSLTLGLFAGLSENLTVTAAIDFLPRNRDISDPNDTGLGNFIDVKLAYAEYAVPVKRFKLSLFAGKFDSVLGIEYRTQDAPDRITVTPSLICRYTCGRPLGLKARGSFFNNVLNVALAVTNGSNFSQYFPFYDNIDSNFFKTVSARIGVVAPVGRGLEIGASGAFGAQDVQGNDAVYHWHYGVDVHLEVHDFILYGEFVQGQAQGETAPGGRECGITQCLTYMGAYGLVAYRALNWLMPYARVDWREALHRSNAEKSFIYVADLMRITGGMHFEIGTAVVLKAEYTYVRELGPIPDFDDNVVTTSLVAKY